MGPPRPACFAMSIAPSVISDSSVRGSTLSSSAVGGKKGKKRVLNEDDFVDGLTAIVERNYYPDLPLLRARQEARDAEDAGDEARLRAALLRERVLASGSNSATGSVDDAGSSVWAPSSIGAGDSASQVAGSVADRHSIDSYLSKYTSEDNASAQRILERDREKLARKRAWMDAAVNKHNSKRAMLIEDKEGSRAEFAVNKGVARNALMWVPEGLGAHPAKAGPDAPRTTVAAATRLAPNAATTRIASGGTPSATPGRTPGLFGGSKQYDLDDRFGGTARATPGYLATPSGSVLGNMTPQMTWGTVDGTPLLLQSDIEDGGTQFKMPNVPLREQVGRNLAKKKGAPVKEGDVGQQRRNALLASSRGSSPWMDHQLRSSYAPSPGAASGVPAIFCVNSSAGSAASRAGAGRTPLFPSGATPRSSVRKVASSTPVGNARDSVPVKKGSEPKESNGCITDGLLNL